jgi:hypothetical protein
MTNTTNSTNSTNSTNRGACLWLPERAPTAHRACMSQYRSGLRVACLPVGPVGDVVRVNQTATTQQAQGQGGGEAMIRGCCVDKECNSETCMDLPDGKTCDSCERFGACLMLGITWTRRRSCDWFPRKYRAKGEVPATAVGSCKACGGPRADGDAWRCSGCPHKANGEVKP